MQLRFKFKANPVFPDVPFGQENLWNLLRSSGLNLRVQALKQLADGQLSEDARSLMEQQCAEVEAICRTLKLVKKDKFLYGTLMIPETSLFFVHRTETEAQIFFKLILQHQINLHTPDETIQSALDYHRRVDKKVLDQIVQSVRIES